jgi:hypothetical protein
MYVGICIYMQKKQILTNMGLCSPCHSLLQINNRRCLTSDASLRVARHQKSQFGFILRALEWKMLVYTTAIWNILPPFGIFYVLGHILWLFGIFSPFYYVVPKNIWQPWDRCYDHNFLRFLTIF